MKIELVGGPKCGEIITIKALDPLVALKDWEGRAVTYCRRNRSYAATSPAGAVYGSGGHRMYDYVKSSTGKE